MLDFSSTGVHYLFVQVCFFWHQCAPTPVDSTPGPAASPTALALPSPGQLGVGDPSACVGHRLNVSQRDRMRRDLESKYTGLYVTESTLPSMPFLQTIQTQANQKAGEWLPWRKVLSERATLDARGHKQRSSREEALDKLLGGPAEEELEQELSPSPFRLQTLLTVRGHAYAMCGAGHLGSWSLHVSRFLEFYAATVGEHFRPPNLAEAEEAEQQTTREIFSLCFSGASLDDAISSVVVDRDMLRQDAQRAPGGPAGFEAQGPCQ